MQISNASPLGDVAGGSAFRQNQTAVRGALRVVLDGLGNLDAVEGPAGVRQ